MSHPGIYEHKGWHGYPRRPQAEAGDGARPEGHGRAKRRAERSEVPVDARGYPPVFRDTPTKGCRSISAHIASNAVIFRRSEKKPGELGVTLAYASRRQAECVWAVEGHGA